MSTRQICDGCHAPLNSQEDYFVVSVTRMNTRNLNPLKLRYHYHLHHLPEAMKFLAPLGISDPNMRTI